MTRRRGPRNRRKPTKKVRQKAAELGPLRPVKVVRRRSADGSPLLEPGQVFAFGGGSVFHPAWCGTVADMWDRFPDSVMVVLESEVGRRRACQNCLAAPLTNHD